MTEQTSLARAALRCFREAGPQSVALLGEMLSCEPPLLMRQCLQVLAVANTVLEEEGRQLAAIFSQQGKPVVCQPGCAGCCHQMVLCQPFEAENIRAHLAAHPESLHAFLHAYPLWDADTSALRHSYLAWAENRYRRGMDDGSHTLEDFRARCPFLDADNRCVIYPVRPYGCRTCMALEPACATREEGQRGTFHLHHSLYTTHHEVRMAVNRLLLDRLGATATPMPMPEMLASLCRA